MPRYYPLLLNLEDQPVLVVGGGPIAARKAATMVEYGALVRIVARRLSPEARRLAVHPRVESIERSYDATDLDDAMIVFAATNDPVLHATIKADCDRRRTPCNVVDVPEFCSFIVPAIIRRGELMVTISTDGMCPAFAKYTRQRLESEFFPEGCEALLHVMAAARRELRASELSHGLTDEEKFALLKGLIEDGLGDLVSAAGEVAAVESARRRILESAAEHIRRTAPRTGTE